MEALAFSKLHPGLGAGVTVEEMSFLNWLTCDVMALEHDVVEKLFILSFAWRHAKVKYEEI